MIKDLSTLEKLKFVVEHKALELAIMVAALILISFLRRD